MLPSEKVLDNKFQNEINILASLESEFIIEFIAAFHDGKSVSTFCLLTQFCEVKEFFNKIFILIIIKNYFLI